MGIRIAYTHNLNVNETPEEAEFDTVETVGLITSALEGAGHVVEPLNVACAVAELVARLESFKPDLVFNTAEGTVGRHREAFYPAVFETMGIPHTGADAYTCTITLDKHLTKKLLAERGVPAPASTVVTNGNAGFDPGAMKFPVMMKPNYEGSSMGITENSIAETPAQFKKRIRELLRLFPSGIIVEEYIRGHDVAVPYLAGVGPEVLDTIQYVYPAAHTGYNIYNYNLKHDLNDAVSIRVPADLPAALTKKLKAWTREAVRTFRLLDASRLDFRVTEGGEAYFIEVNALPSLQPDAGFFVCAKRHGLDFAGTINAIVESARRRYGIKGNKPRSAAAKRGGAKSGPLTIGFVYNVKRVGAFESDAEAEYDSPEAIEAIKASIEANGHPVVMLEATPALPRALSDAKVDLVFNIAEGSRGRNRESQAPALCEMLGIEHTGSDAAALALSLDKSVTKKLMKVEGVVTPEFFMMKTGDERVPKGMKFPLIVKPNFEGTSKGIDTHSTVDDEDSLRKLAKKLIRGYGQPVIAEEYIRGRELSVGLLGGPPPHALPIMEVVFLEGRERPVYTYELKQEWEGKIDYVIPAKLTKRESAGCAGAALKAFASLGCRDFGRVDMRLAEGGTPYVLEVNPLPGISPGFSDLAKIAEAAGIDHKGLIGAILECGIRRLIQRQKTF